MVINTLSASSLTLVQQDQRLIWHPFTQMQTARPPIPIVRAKGTVLYAEDGQTYLDGISSWWVNLHGHAHPHIANQIRKQCETLEHIIFADFTHQPAIELANRLLAILPGKFSKVFFSDNGSTAVEAALKMSIQYWFNQTPKKTKTKVVCFKGGYHGDTFGAMSAAGKNIFNQPFWNHLFKVEVIDPPLIGQEKKSLRQLKHFLKEDDVACFIFEPLILGVGGMQVYSKSGLDRLLKACHRQGVITIADEVMTGFGRTETLFASEQTEEKPVIICLSKGITGGFLPLGVTACEEWIFQGFLSDQLSKAFLHGHSYSANPLACASALASLDLLESRECQLKRQKIQVSHQEFCQKWSTHPKLKRCETMGTILILEYATNSPTSYLNHFRDRLYHFFLDRGILLRPFGNVLHVMPPYCITEDELQSIYSSIILSFEEIE